MKQLLEGLKEENKGPTRSYYLHSGIITGALIAVSYDIPTAWKVYQFLVHKAKKESSRCEFELAERENPQNISSRMNYFTAIDIILRLNDTVR